MKTVRGARQIHTFYYGEDDIERNVICDVYLTEDDFEMETVMYGSKDVIDDLTKDEYNGLEERCIAAAYYIDDDRGNEQ